MMRENKQEQCKELLELVQQLVAQDKALREQYKIADKFRFIRDRLAMLLSKVEEVSVAFQQEIVKQESKSILAEDEALVFVHIFNAQGLVLQSWQKLLLPSVYYEYSVNRPIYTERSYIESFVRSKPNKVQHGYLAVVVKKSMILPLDDTKDSAGNPVVKVKDGALDPKRMISFTHSNQEYILNASGELIKKEE